MQMVEKLRQAITNKIGKQSVARAHYWHLVFVDLAFFLVILTPL